MFFFVSMHDFQDAFLGLMPCLDRAVQGARQQIVCPAEHRHHRTRMRFQRHQALESADLKDLDGAIHRARVQSLETNGEAHHSMSVAFQRHSIAESSFGAHY